MLSVTSSNQRQSTPTRVPLGYDFALLGLKAREARVDVIRSAAESTAAKIPAVTEDEQRVDMLAELATATYRLLDPRRRAKPMERLLLSIASDAEPSLATVAKKPLINGPLKRNLVPLVAANIVEVGEITDLVLASTQSGFHKVSHNSDESGLRKFDRDSRVGVIAVSVLSTLIASSAWIGWLLFG